MIIKTNLFLTLQSGSQNSKVKNLKKEYEAAEKGYQVKIDKLETWTNWVKNKIAHSPVAYAAKVRVNEEKSDDIANKSMTNKK